jgi:heat shock protein HtpX
MTGDTRLLFLTTTFSNIFRTMGQAAWPTKQRGGDLYNIGSSSPNASMDADLAISLMLLAAILKLTNIGALFAACFVSRSRDLVADTGAIELTKNPQALIKALQIAKSNLCGFYREDDIKPLLLHYQKGRETCGHLSIEERVHDIRRFMPGS